MLGEFAWWREIVSLCGRRGDAGAVYDGGRGSTDGSLVTGFSAAGGVPGCRASVIDSLVEVFAGLVETPKTERHDGKAGVFRCKRVLRTAIQRVEGRMELGAR